MPASKTGEYTFEPTEAEQIADNLLLRAGLPKRWLPTHIDADLLLAGQEVSRISDGFEELTSAELSTVDEFAVGLAEFSASKIKGADSESRNYRAKSAIRNGVGNCMAFHEVISGTLSKLGLGQFAVGQWLAGHASSGFVIRDRAIGIDGYSAAIESCWAAEVTKPEPKQAMKTAVSLGVATVFWSDSDKDSEWLGRARAELPDLALAPCSPTADKSGVILPAAGAILMYSGMAVSFTDNPRFNGAKSLLGTFAPPF